MPACGSGGRWVSSPSGSSTSSPTPTRCRSRQHRPHATVLPSCWRIGYAVRPARIWIPTTCAARRHAEDGPVTLACHESCGRRHTDGAEGQDQDGGERYSVSMPEELRPVIPLQLQRNSLPLTSGIGGILMRSVIDRLKIYVEKNDGLCQFSKKH